MQDRDDSEADRQHREEQTDGDRGAHLSGREEDLANDVEPPMATT